MTLYTGLALEPTLSPNGSHHPLIMATAVSGAPTTLAVYFSPVHVLWGQ